MLDPDKHQNVFEAAHDNNPTPENREHPNRVFNEEFLEQASKEDLTQNIDCIKAQEWDKLKAVNPIYYRIRRERSVTPTNCSLYDNKVVIQNKLKTMIFDTIHNKRPGQAGMLALANLVLYPRIHSDIVAQAQGCRHCIETGQILKPPVPRKNRGTLPLLSELNEKI